MDGMIRLVLALALSIVALAVPAVAQSVNWLTTDDFLIDWKNSKAFTIAVAEKMPAESYSFKATPEEMSFGEQMVHISAGLYVRFQAISGVASPFKGMPKEVTKQVALEWLNGSFDYVLQVLPKITAAQLDATKFPVNWPGREVKGREMIRNMFMHVAHHRAQCEVYLRLKGIAPPGYVF